MAQGFSKLYIISAILVIIWYTAVLLELLLHSSRNELSIHRQLVGKHRKEGQQKHSIGLFFNLAQGGNSEKENQNQCGYLVLPPGSLETMFKQTSMLILIYYD